MLHDFLLHKIVEPSENRDFQTLLAGFRSSGGVLKKKLKSKINFLLSWNSMFLLIFSLFHAVETIDRRPQRSDQTNNIEAVQLRDALDINNHQSLPLLFTYFYYSHDGTCSFCVHPNLLNISFYGENDIMLGQFLERYCFDNSYVCNACKLPVLGHIRR